jgi:hypothetical protein
LPRKSASFIGATATSLVSAAESWKLHRKGKRQTATLRDQLTIMGDISCFRLLADKNIAFGRVEGYLHKSLGQGIEVNI